MARHSFKDVSFSTDFTHVGHSFTFRTDFKKKKKMFTIRIRCGSFRLKSDEVNMFSLRLLFSIA